MSVVANNVFRIHLCLDSNSRSVYTNQTSAEAGKPPLALCFCVRNGWKETVSKRTTNVAFTAVISAPVFTLLYNDNFHNEIIHKEVLVAFSSHMKIGSCCCFNVFFY